MCLFRMENEIRKTAIELFHEAGAGFTLEQLADRTGLPRATLYRRIGSKEKLLKALADDNLIRLDDDPSDIDSRVIAAARKVIAKSGFLACTMDQIAGEAGIGVATLYRRFKRKEDLLDRVARQMAPKPVVRQATEGREPEFERDLRQMVDIGLRFGLQNQDIARIVFAARPAEQKFVASHRKVSAAGFSSLVQYMQACQDKGLLRQDMPAEDLAMLLNGLIAQYSVLGPAYLDRPLDMERDAKSIMTLFLLGAGSAVES